MCKIIKISLNNTVSEWSVQPVTWAGDGFKTRRNLYLKVRRTPYLALFSSVADPDSGIFWIRIRNPGPGAEKKVRNVE